MITTLATSQNFQKEKKDKKKRKKSDVKYSAFVQRWPATALQKKILARFLCNRWRRGLRRGFSSSLAKHVANNKNKGSITLYSLAIYIKKVS
jgi:hypothetical protein